MQPVIGGTQACTRKCSASRVDRIESPVASRSKRIIICRRRITLNRDVDLHAYVVHIYRRTRPDYWHP